IAERKPRSVLCIPILYQAQLVGVAYLENNRVTHVFNEAKVDVASLLAGQAAISIANARFHDLRLEAQQSKINPHFLFNALSSIAEVATQDGTKAEEAMLKLAHLYRYIIETSTDRLVTLEQELAVVGNYLALEKLRFGDKLQYTLSCPEHLGSVTIPGLL